MANAPNARAGKGPVREGDARGKDAGGVYILAISMIFLQQRGRVVRRRDLVRNMVDNQKALADFDERMATVASEENGIVWHLPTDHGMQLDGFFWYGKDGCFDRLPGERPAVVTQYPEGIRTEVPASECGAYGLAKNTAGGQLRFRTDSSCLQVRGVLRSAWGMDHMAMTGSAGFDAYLKCGGVWKCFGVTRTDHSKVDFSTAIYRKMHREMRDVILNFPLYNGVQSLEIGLDADARLEPPTPHADQRPIVWYGTSIQQGGCASRPGMAASNILSRHLDRTVLNFGFSGSGKGEPELARILTEVKNPSLYIVDYTWNVDPRALAATLPDFLDILRNKYPRVPILLVSPTPGKGDLPELSDGKGYENTAVLVEEARRRWEGGDDRLFYYDLFSIMMQEEFWEGEVDGCHLTDLGFMRAASLLEPVICRILEEDAR